MSRNWTPQQKNAIYATDGSVLVSAAAGSGKTAVLVERVIKLITREKNPLDVDRLLIVTFTRAAAAEMRERIQVAVNKLLEDDPYNAHLLAQRQLLYSANISTIDSFCGDIVREYFHTLDVARDFRIADEGELEILRQEALDNTFESFYDSEDDCFYSLLDLFKGKQGDQKLRETVLKISEFLTTQPFPDKWLDDMLENYSETDIEKTVFSKIKGIWFGGYEHESGITLSKILKDTIGDEYDFPIIQSSNFGHIDKKTVIPIGIRVRIDTEDEVKIRLLEKCVK